MNPFKVEQEVAVLRQRPLRARFATIVRIAHENATHVWVQWKYLDDLGARLISRVPVSQIIKG